MDAVSYPHHKVIGFINENMIPLRIQFGSQPYTSDFKIKWTPTLVILDTEAEEHHRTVGFLDPEVLIPSLLLGMGKVYFDTDRFDGALFHLQKLLADYPRTAPAPEALYLKGVSLYKSTDKVAPLKQTYERLLAEYPDSEWTKRAYPYRLI